MAHELAALDLPDELIERVMLFSHKVKRATFAELVALTCRMERTRANLERAKADLAEGDWQPLGGTEAQLNCMWRLVEAEMERRAPRTN